MRPQFNSFFNVCVLQDSQEHLEIAISSLKSLISQAGFKAVQEKMNLKSSFFSLFPCGFSHAVRVFPLIPSDALADFFPLHNFPLGYKDNNFLGSYVSLLETPSHTPLFFNFHRKGSLDSSDLTSGHTGIFGSTGAGKTVLMNFLDSQLEKYHHKAFFFDMDRGSEIYVRASEGEYSLIEKGTDLAFNPFQGEDSPLFREFLVEFMCLMCSNKDEELPPSSVIKEIKVAVDYVFTLPQSDRTLSNCVKVLPQNFARWDNIELFLKAEGDRTEGTYAYLFDNVEDKLNINTRKIGFDITSLMGKPSQIVALVFSYLFYRIEESLLKSEDKPLTAIWIDEGWMALRHPYFSEKLRKWLATLRKLKGFLVLATQDVGSVVSSPIANVFRTNMTTGIFYPNEKPIWEDYQALGLKESEFDEFIAKMKVNSREFLYKNGDLTAVAKLDLGGFEKELRVLSATSENVDKLAKIRSIYGDHPNNWLSHFYEEVSK